MNDFEIRPVTKADYDFILRLNRENVEVLSPMDSEKLLYFTNMSSLFYVACVNGKPAAFLIALTEAADTYESENFRWFLRHYEHFLYIDRIVIDAPFRKNGLGKALYGEVIAFAHKNGIPFVTAEVDTIPYNEASLGFHRAMGFREVGTQFVRDGSIKVSLLVKEL